MVEGFHSGNLSGHFVVQIFRQDRCAVFPAFASPDKNEIPAEIHILNMQTEVFRFSPPEDVDGFYHRSNEYNEVSIDNRSALCDTHNGDIKELLEPGPLI